MNATFLTEKEILALPGFTKGQKLISKWIENNFYDVKFPIFIPSTHQDHAGRGIFNGGKMAVLNQNGRISLVSLEGLKITVWMGKPEDASDMIIAGFLWAIRKSIISP